MTTSHWKKALKQLEEKPGIKVKYEKHNKPKDRAHGVATRRCELCGTHKAHISKYGIGLCRFCFRQFASELGFKKYR